MGPRSSVNRPLTTIAKKKRSGCRSMKTLKKKKKIAKRRKVQWKKLILPNMETDDDTNRAAQPTQKKTQKTKPMTGKQRRKLRKKVSRLAAKPEKMEGIVNEKKEEQTVEDSENARSEDEEMEEAE
ncbi:hypothetical protein HOLleu_16565 [Holothuria leucospilota]|uniref:Uncharacterized protein n=1 Tax=Holothuria leucospilota TaxID=206669 RepID=A0A9Q1C493_HOLLE|nr:hypothetical protein HOLleu_16565 [Holothuria leucospilota]